MLSRIFLILIATLCLADGILFAQTATSENPTCDEEFALFLVEQQVSESETVEHTDKRIRILLRAADFMWKFDEPRARTYFSQAFKFAGDRFNEKGFEKKDNKGLTSLMPDYRFEVIKAISSKDAEWAKRLVDQLLKEYEKAAADRHINDKNREIDDVIRLAIESVKTNPALSRHLFQRAMAYPLDFYWYFALFAVAADNRQFADELYVDLLRNYANATPRRLLFLSAYPFVNARIFGIDKYGYGTTVPDSLSPNRGLQAHFIEAFLRRAIAFASDPQNINLPAEEYRQPEPVYIITALTELEPIIIQQFPSLIQRFSEAKAQVTGLLTEQM